MFSGAPFGPLYSTLTNIPFDGQFEHAFNPRITGCTDQTAP
jgi:hypothetical protein